MPEQLDVAGRIIVLQPVFRMVGAQRKSLRDLLVDDDINLDTAVRSIEQQLVESVALVLRGGSSQVKLRAEPPVEDPDGVAGVLKCFGDCPHVAACVDVPGRYQRPGRAI